tara:strand:- start:3 stop:620 length:618 start_codon:yes stop_codon:yes gene_type:complete
MDKTQINEAMKPHEIKPPKQVIEDVWDVEGSVKDLSTPQFRVKASTLANHGKLHIQFSCPDVEGLHSDMQEELGTPFVKLSNSSLRQYGIAFDMQVKTGSADQGALKALGEQVMENKDNLCKSLASEADDYSIMEYIGLEKGVNNKGEEVSMLTFGIGSPDNEVMIAFSHVPSSEDVGGYYEELRPEWLMAWLTSRYLAGQEEEE